MPDLVLRWPHPLLQEPARKVVSFNGHTARVFDMLLEAMDALRAGGLAAPQLGILRRMIVVRRPGGETLELANPQVVLREGSDMRVEVCPSVPEATFGMIRSQRLLVEGADRQGIRRMVEVHGELAGEMEHQLAHLDGVVFQHLVRDRLVAKGPPS